MSDTSNLISLPGVSRTDITELSNDATGDLLVKVGKNQFYDRATHSDFRDAGYEVINVDDLRGEKAYTLQT